MAKFWSGLQWFYANHIQKVLGTILAGSALFDLMSALDLYSATLTQILGLHTYSVIRGICAIGIVIRAVVKPKS